MKLEQLEYFLDICQTHSLNQSAKRLFLTQTGLTKSLQKMETELGTCLFERTKTGIFLNETGRSFKPYAEKILENYEEALNSISKSTKFSTPITIYTQPILSEIYMPTFLDLLYHRFPQLKLNIVDNPANLDCKDFFSCIMNNPFSAISFSVNLEPAIPESFQSITVGQDTIAAFIRPDHPFHAKKHFSLDFLSENKSMVLFWNNPFFDHQYKNDTFSSVTNLSVLKNLVIHNDYIVCFPSLLGSLIFQNNPILKKELPDIDPVYYQVIANNKLSSEFIPVFHFVTSAAQRFFRKNT